MNNKFQIGDLVSTLMDLESVGIVCGKITDNKGYEFWKVEWIKIKEELKRYKTGWSTSLIPFGKVFYIDKENKL